MSDEFDKEITTKKVSTDANTTGEGYTVSKQRTTRVNNDSANTGLIFGILAILSLGVGAGLYFMNNRPTPVQILAPATAPATNQPAKENKSTIIERNNTTIREVQPAAPQPIPKVEVNVPAPAPAAIIVNPPAAAPAPVTAPAPAATPAATTPAATPVPETTTPASTQTPAPQTATPSPASTPAN